ncbi:uncharacterized protein [Temnothorax nylanderi]|uniref:uncharacterized protein n=1 Tax=Temnothorax nylanderi TaxID=102681 RepID=UPI003A88C3D3
MPGNKKRALFKRKIPFKHRISTKKHIKLNELKAIATGSINSNNSTQRHVCESNNDDTNVDSFLENHIGFQEEGGNYLNIDPDSNLCSNSSNYSDNFSISSKSNSTIENSAFIDYDDINNEQSIAEQNCDKQSDIDETSQFNNEQEKNNYLLNALREWSLRGVSKKKVDALLALLKPLFPFLPKSYKTLLHTSRKIIVSDLGDGQFWYKGIKTNIRQLLSDEYIYQHGEIVIDINIDGIPLSKSSEKHFWPILGKFRDLKYPFLIAVYLGSGKPNDVNVFLEEFVTEVANLQENGFEWSNGTTYQFRIDNFVLDAEARSFVKKCVAHGGYYACEKCIVKGTHYRNRMCFFEQNCPRRTDESFRNRDNPRHHNGNSILEDIGIGMVSQFRLDVLHLVYLGVVKRMLYFLISVRSRCTLPDAVVFQINNMLRDITDCFPIEFTRKPRSLGVRNKREKWKGSEFRRFILYDCIYVLKDHVPTNVFQCFLLLHCAIYILCRHDLFQEMKISSRRGKSH